MSTAVTTAPKKELRSLITSDAVQSQLAIALPRYYTPDQFTLIVRTALNRNPKLAECDQASFLASMLSAAQMGILPNGRDGHLIPRWNGKQQRRECTFMPDYKGIVGLIRRNDEVADIYAVCVRKGDVFKITQGLHRDIIHEPNYEKPGEIIGVYAVILFKSGLSTWEYLPRPEVEAIRERSDSWKAHVANGYDTPWKTDEGEMFKKTALKRVSKLADLSPDTMDRILADPEIQFEKPAQATEIKRAEIPGQAALPPAGEAEQPEPEQQEAPQEEVPAAEPEAQPEPPKATKPEPAKKGKFGGHKAKTQDPESIPADPKENPKVTEIKKRLTKGGWTIEQYVKALAAFDLSESDVAFATADETTLDAILENWDQLEGELKKQ